MQPQAPSFLVNLREGSLRYLIRVMASGFGRPFPGAVSNTDLASLMFKQTKTYKNEKRKTPTCRLSIIPFETSY